MSAAAIRLSQVAPWNSSLRNPYRTRYTQAGGRYYKVEADNLDALWTVHQIDANDDILEQQKLPNFGWVAVAFNLAQVRAAIEAHAAGKTADEIGEAVRAVGRVGTGRSHPRNVERRRSSWRRSAY